jgi:type II secretory pathway pseudopilin PulG
MHNLGFCNMKCLSKGNVRRASGIPLHSVAKRCIFRTPAGATLLEVMIAVVIISVALLGTMSVFINAERISSLCREESIAQAAITQMISKIRGSKFVNIMNSQTAVPNPGFSGGVNTGYQRYPGSYQVDVGGDKLPRGLLVSSTAASGFIQMGARWYAPSPVNAAEMRVIFVNDEDPVELEIGATATAPTDGCDLDQDGQISSVPFFVPPSPFWTPTTAGPESVNPIPFSYTAFQAPDPSRNITSDLTYSPGGATCLFPRRLGSGTANPPVHQYLDITQILVLPVIVQVRWWSQAGVPRDMMVITFITNRS